MLRAMNELEKVVGELLDRFQGRPQSPSETEKVSGQRGGHGECLEREREAVEWIRRALDRLRKL